MAILSPKLRDWRHAGARGLLFYCPGCESAHNVVVEGSPSAWAWNGDVERPTLSPSVLVTLREGPERPGEPPGPLVEQCHSFMRDGRIEFLGDCTHKLAGQAVEIPDWPANYGGGE